MGTFAWEFGNQFNAYYNDKQTVGTWEETDKIVTEVQSQIDKFLADKSIKN